MQKLNKTSNLGAKKIFKAIYNLGKKIASSKLIFASVFLIIGSLITYSCQQHQDVRPASFDAVAGAGETPTTMPVRVGGMAIYHPNYYQLSSM